MSVRFVLGRAGSGKTHHCLSGLRAELRENPLGSALILLVPEQAAAQMERALLADSQLTGTFRAQVLSFRRLAYKILTGTGPSSRIIPSVTERIILRHLLNEHKSELKVYGPVTDRPGLVNKLLENLKELISEGAEPTELRRAAAGIANPQLANKINDLAILLDAYRQYVARHGLERTAALNELPDKILRTDFLQQARIWVDGFAGFTAQETQVLLALAQCSETMDICLLLDPESTPRDSNSDPLRLFRQTQQTFSALSDALKKAGLVLEKTLRLSPAARAVCPAIKSLEANLFSNHRQPTKPQPGSTHPTSSIHLIEAPDPRREIDAVVRQILHLTRRKEDPLRYRDIAVIVRDLSAYHDLLACSFAEHSLPFFIDRRYNLSHHALIELLRNALSLLTDDFSHQAVRGLLKTSLLGIDSPQLDRLENYILAHGLRGASLWQGPDWNYRGHMTLPGDVEDANAAEEQDLARINATRRQILQRLGPWSDLAGPVGQTNTPRLWVQAVVELLARLKVREQLSHWAHQAAKQGRAELAEQHRRVWQCLLELLEQMVEVLGDEQISLAEFTDILNAAMAEFSLGLVPPKLDQILIGSVQRSRHPSLRAAFVIGFNEGIFPRSLPEDSVLSDRERQFLDKQGVRLGPTAEELFFRERLLAYIALTRPRDYLWISYAAADQAGKTLNASPFVAELLRALPGLELRCLPGFGTTDDPALATTPARLAAALAGRFRTGLDDLPQQITRRWLNAYSWLIQQSESHSAKNILSSLIYKNTPHLDPRTRQELLGRTIRTSKTSLESFAACPFQHFADRLLNLTERPDSSLQDMDLGRLYHRAMEILGRELIRSRSRLAQLTREKAVQRITSISNDLIDQLSVTEPALQTGRNQFLAAYMQQHLCQAVTAGHLRSELGRLYPVAVEQKFGINDQLSPPGDSWPALTFALSDKRTLELRGVIDLLELAQDPESDSSLYYAVVYDYKRSREKQFKLAEAYHGLDLQLLIYLLAVRQLAPKALNVKTIEPIGGFYVSLKTPTIPKAKPGQEPDEDDLLKKSRPRGLFRSDKIPLIDNTETGKLRAVLATITKGGGFSKAGGDWLSANDFELVLSYASTKIHALAHQILNGLIGVQPFRLGAKIPCTYCQYRSVCRVEPLTRPYRELPTMGKEKVLENMQQSK